MCKGVWRWGWGGGPGWPARMWAGSDRAALPGACRRERGPVERTAHNPQGQSAAATPTATPPEGLEHWLTSSIWRAGGLGATGRPSDEGAPCLGAPQARVHLPSSPHGSAWGLWHLRGGGAAEGWR